MPEKTSKKGVIVASTSRPPVVVVMGHIDHGKSTLLDYIRKTNVTETEAGGITQRISAYQAVHAAKDGTKHTITFLDTPGHESFSAMRERGAFVADIAILVVAADDGVKPQTIEALKTIKNAKIPFIVAINKIDKDNADIEHTKATLAENDVYVEGYGGDVPVVNISAKTGQGVPELLDMLVLVAELADLKGDPTKPAEGAIIEAFLDKRKGISATIVIKNGTLRTGQTAACVGANAADEIIGAISPIRMIESFVGASIKEAGLQLQCESLAGIKCQRLAPLFQFSIQRRMPKVLLRLKRPGLKKSKRSKRQKNGLPRKLSELRARSA